jgi:hypothetical protein
MSADQFSNKPLPPEKRLCPRCGEAILDDAKLCWLCREQFAFSQGQPKRPRMRGEPSTGSGLGWLAAVVVVILLALTLAYEAPGVLAVLLILATPVLIRMAISPPRKESATVGSVAGSVLGTLGLVIAIGLASFVAFFATCFVVCLGAITIADMQGGLGRGSSETWIWVVSIGGGLVVGGLFYLWMMKRLVR